MAAEEYYDHTTVPATGTPRSSAQMRAELDAIEAGFGKLPGLAGHGGEIVRVNPSGTALEGVPAAVLIPPPDAELAAIAALASATDTLPYFTAPGAAALTALTAFARSLVAAADAASARALLGISSSNDPELAAIAALTSAPDTLPYFTGPGTAALADFTAFARAFVAAVDGRAAHVTQQDGGLFLRAGSRFELGAASIEFPGTGPLVKYTATAAGVSVGALAAPGAGSGFDMKLVSNVGTLHPITFRHEDASSPAAQRFTFPGAFDKILSPGAGMIVYYDSVTSRWKPLSDEGTVGWTLIETVNLASAEAAVVLDFPSDPTLFERYFLTFNGVKPATDDVYLRVRYIATGPSLITTGYSCGFTRCDADGTHSHGSTPEGLGASIALSALGGSQPGKAVGNGAGEHISGVLEMARPASADFKAIYYRTTYMSADGNLQVITGGGTSGSVAALSALQLSFEAGNIAAGTFRLYGLRG